MVLSQALNSIIRYMFEEFTAFCTGKPVQTTYEDIILILMCLCILRAATDRFYDMLLSTYAAYVTDILQI